MSTRLLVVALGCVLLAAGGATAVAVGTDGDSDVTSTTAELPTVVVTRGDLSSVQRFDGTVGYAAPVPITGVGTGLVTWLPSAGVTVRRGEQLYRVNDAPVTLLYGDLPLYRTLQVPRGKKARPVFGNDVDLLARNLRRLGFWDGSTEDVPYSSRLADAVKRWQQSQDVASTGSVTLGSVVTAPGPLRVAAVVARVGTAAAQDVLTVTSLATVVTVAVPAVSASSLRPGSAVTVRLASGRPIAATVSRIGAATSGGASSDGAPSDGAQQPTVPVVVKASRSADFRGARPGPVTASIVAAARRGVLKVPVSALLALAGGGYALERPDHRLVPVKVGAVIDGAAEVTGVAEGARVLVAR